MYQQVPASACKPPYTTEHLPRALPGPAGAGGQRGQLQRDRRITLPRSALALTGPCSVRCSVQGAHATVQIRSGSRRAPGLVALATGGRRRWRRTRCRPWRAATWRSGQYAAMHMLLQKTVLNINVADHRRPLRQGDAGPVRADRGRQGLLARPGPPAGAGGDRREARGRGDGVQARHPAEPLDRRREGQPRAGAQGGPDHARRREDASAIRWPAGSARSRTAATRRTTG